MTSRSLSDDVQRDRDNDRAGRQQGQSGRPSMTGDEGPEDGTVGELENRTIDVANEERHLRAEVISRLRGQLSLMRAQVGRLQQALNQAENLRSAARDRLQSLRGTTERLEQALRMEEAAQQAPRAEVSAASDEDPSTEPSWQPVTMTGGQQKNHLVRVDLREQHIHALLVSGVLSIRDVDNAAKVGQVVQALLDRWAEQYGTREVAQPAAQAARDRRGTQERRHAGPRANCLLSYVNGTPFDRRQQDERRHGPDGSVMARRLPSREPATAAAAAVALEGTTGGTVVRLDDLRARAERSLRRPRRPIRTDDESDTGSTASIALFPLAHSQVKGVEGEPAPDADEACERRSGNGLLVGEGCEQELATWGDELQEPQHCERDPARGSDEEDER